MTKYLKWVAVGLVIIVLVALWVAVAANTGLRQKLEAIMMQLIATRKVADLREKAATIQNQIKNNNKQAEDIEKQTEEIEKQINDHKSNLTIGLLNRGMSAEEIADRLSSL